MARQYRAQVTRRRILDAAAEVFAREGFARASLDYIGKASGMTKGAIYFHFSAKEDMATAVQAEGCERLRGLVADLTARPLPVMQAVIDMMHVLVHWFDREPSLRASFRLAQEQGAHDGGFTGIYGCWLDVARDLLRRARDQGELRTDVCDDSFSVMIVALGIGLESLAWARFAPARLTAALRTMWQAMLPEIVVADLVGRLDVHGPRDGAGRDELSDAAP